MKMNAKIVFGFVLACLAIVAEVSGRSCTACGFGDGTDYCAECSTFMIRPAALNKPKVPCGKMFRPVGDACACGNVQVQPVALPKPKYTYKEKKSKVCDDRPLIPAPAHMHDFGQEEDEYLLDSTVIQENMPCGNQKPMYPVDAVSIDLVNRMQQSAAMKIPEEKLQYGFWKLPKDVPSYKVLHNIPEEKLYTVDRQIVELKHPRQMVNCGSTSEDEIILDDKEPQPIAYLSYRDLGFVPESMSGHKFVSQCQEKKPCGRTIAYEQEYMPRKPCNEGVFMKRIQAPSRCCC